MSTAVYALLLIRLEAWRGEWLTVDALAQHLAIRHDLVRQHLQLMFDAGEVALRHAADGQIEAACIDPPPGGEDPEPHPLPRPPGLERSERLPEASAGHSGAPIHPLMAA